jgi:broad specificity phosphatase PhoE
MMAAQPLEAVVASNLVRTQQTAAPTARRHGLDVLARDGLREIAGGVFEGRDDAASRTLYLKTILAWASGEEHIRMRGGETGTEVFARFDAVAAEVSRAGVSVAALFSHGAMIRSWVGSRVSHLPADFIARTRIPNTGMVVLDGDHRQGWRALACPGAGPGTSPLRADVS